MIHDKDLKRWRWTCVLMAALNLGAAVPNALEHRWPVVMACVIWALCCVMLHSHTATQQKTRDEARVTQAGIRALLERAEEETQQQPYIVCPKCGMVSHNPHDIQERYCGNCHAFHDDLLKRREER